ncbi:FUSC family protein [Echinicola sp. CAU 1574]|uniref:FUSC family protein n=1 Tax=Echinicola arenosa TaxID=2774144 RepID=A0ABR9AN47_9BACT|nr:FUSC family protein [Echinicola arenosa]MBD8489767.1 FUSC family protein [Echinicola arenosa]
MEQRKLAALTDKELLVEAKKMKSTKIYDAALFGLLVGIAIYSSLVNGFGLLTFLPLVYLPIAGKNKAKARDLKQILKERNLSEG